MTLDPRQIRAFLGIVEHGSLGRAAAALNLTQPALSRILHRLEDQLGVALFERHSLGMSPTLYGQTLLPYARLLSREAANALEEVAALRGLSKGVVRVGAIASAAIMLLPSALDRLLARWPGLRVQIMEAVEDQLTVALEHNEIDLAICGAIPETEIVARIAENEFHDVCRVVAATDHPLQGRGDLTPADLFGHPWVMPPREATPRQQLHQMMLALGYEPPPVAVETRSVSTIRELVARHRFLTWMPEPLYAPEQAAGLVRALPVAGMDMERHFFVYRRRRGLLPPAAVKLLEELRASPPAP